MPKTGIGFLSLFLLLFLLHVPLLAIAAPPGPDLTKRVEITAMAGWQWGGSVNMLTGSGTYDSGAAFDGIIAIRTQADGLMGVTYSLQRTDFTATFLNAQGNFVRRTVPVNVGYAHFTGELELAKPEQRFVPFIGLSVGATHMTPRGGGQTGWFFSAGFIGGLKYRLFEHVGLRAQMRLLTTVLNGDSRLFCVSSGGLSCALSTDLEGMIQGDLVGGVYVAF